ncbi:hypothetical protein D918_00609 [Trichuris suis]|nr:hypothetical protein D918_00609 [Trichuris suis]
MKRAYIITVLILLPSFVVSAPTDECPSEGGTRKFIQRQLEGKTSCYELTRSECLFIHEAIDTCACTCDVLIKSSEDTARQTYTATNEVAGGGGGGADAGCGGDCGCQRCRRRRKGCC